MSGARHDSTYIPDTDQYGYGIPDPLPADGNNGAAAVNYSSGLPAIAGGAHNNMPQDSYSSLEAGKAVYSSSA